eukprot:TRINITY_DN2166_c0_g1_i2.p1 TRINITY_DN2166_c0_g1~~TRINITY_DN2166_c0_g1_i2.p1  ORF type:complete len:227 (-),score=40.30 TRINITY_DN2166_c0_g1_i2:146-826(-)
MESHSNDLKTLRKGATLLKCTRKREPHFRFFRLSENNEHLKWMSPKKKTEESSVRIRDVTELRLGQKTSNFQKQCVPQYEHLSFSLIYGQRTLDIVCKDKKEYETWTNALRCLLSTTSTTAPSNSPLTPVGFRPLSTVEGSDECLQVYFRGNTTVVVPRESKNDVYTWGQGENGRLGHDNESDQLVPKVIEALLAKEIRGVSCGPSHSAALSLNGQLWTWGSGGFC